MQPIEKITEKDFHIMANILDEYNFYGKDTNFLKGFLKKVWNNTKANLFEMFGEELILKKEIIIENDEDFILEKLEKLWSFNNPGYEFLANFRDFIYDIYKSSNWSYTANKDFNFSICFCFEISAILSDKTPFMIISGFGELNIWSTE